MHPFETIELRLFLKRTASLLLLVKRRHHGEQEPLYVRSASGKRGRLQYTLVDAPVSPIFCRRGMKQLRTVLPFVYTLRQTAM